MNPTLNSCAVIGVALINYLLSVFLALTGFSAKRDSTLVEHENVCRQ